MGAFWTTHAKTTYFVKLLVKIAEKVISLKPLISNAPTMMINLIGKKTQIACGLLCCCSMAYAQSNDNSEVVVLNAGWEFSQARSYGDRHRFPALFIRILSIINKFPILFMASMNKRFSGWKMKTGSTGQLLQLPPSN